MTCIVGLECEGGAWIGGDSQGVTPGWLSRMDRRDPKVRVLASGLVLGFSGSYRYGQALAYADDPPTPPSRSDGAGGEGLSDSVLQRWAVRDLSAWCRRVLAEAGARKKDDELESAQGIAVFGIRGRICVLESDFQVAWPRLPYVSIGCGFQVALGALWALTPPFPDPSRDEGEDRVRAALRGAMFHNAGCGGEIDLLWSPST